jgi:hypothetical protein
MAGTPASRRAAGVQAEGGFAGNHLQGAKRPKMGGSRSKRAEGGALSLSFRAADGGAYRILIVQERSFLVAFMGCVATMALIF